MIQGHMAQHAFRFFLELFDTLEEWIAHGFEFERERKEFLNKASEEVSKLQEDMKASGATAAAARMPIFDADQGLPTTKNLLAQVKSHEQRRIKHDVTQAVGSIRSREDQLVTLKKYIAHVKAHTSERDKIVPHEYREPPNEEGPNTGFLRRMEAIFLHSDNADNLQNSPAIDRFRSEVKQRIGIWSAESDNAGQNPLDHAEELFPDLLEKMDYNDMKINKDRVTNFLQDMRIFYELKGKIDNHKVFQLAPERKVILLSALEFLRSDELGYCDKCIAKLLDFAYHEKATLGDDI